MARRFGLTLILTLAVLAAIVVWRDQGIVLNYFPPEPAVGLAPDELGAILLAALLPALAINPLSGLEQLAQPKPRRRLTMYSLVIAVIPATTAIVWATAVHLHQPLDKIPSVVPRALSFGLLGLVGLIMTLLVGATWGPLLSLTLFCAFLIAQNAYGPDLAGHVLSTGSHWHTNLWVDAIALALAAWFSYRRAGVPLMGQANTAAT